MRFILLIILLSLGFRGVAGEFAIKSLPVGSDLTLLPDIRAKIPLRYRIRLSPRDLPQTIKFIVVAKTAQRPEVKLAIFDSNQDKVIYRTLKPGVPSLYSFFQLEPIMIKAEILDPKETSLEPYLHLYVESDKPLKYQR